MEDGPERLEQLGALTPREREILHLMCAGLSDQGIVDELVVAPSTLYFHKGHIYDKLGLRDLAKGARQRELGRYCVALDQSGGGAVPPDEPEDDPPVPSERALVAVREDTDLILTVPSRPAREIELVTPPKGWADPPRRRVNPWLVLIVVAIGGGLIGGGIVGVAGLLGQQRTSVAVSSNPPQSSPTNRPQPSGPPGNAATQSSSSPAPTAVPTPRPVETNTPAGSILGLGDTWHQEGVRVTLDNAHLESNRFLCETALGFRVRAVNTTGTDLIANASTDDWYSIDSAGRRRVITTRGGGSGGCLSWPVSLLRPGTLDFPTAYVSVSLQELAPLTWVRVVIPQLSRVENAAWEIPVPR